MKDLLRTRWAAVGAAVAVTFGAGGLSLTHAAETDGGPVFISLDKPCRVIDTRPAPDNVQNLAPRTTPIGDGEIITVQITGNAGNCVGAVPADATGVAINLTAIDNTAQSHFRVFPADVADADMPLTSNLNFGPESERIANKVDVDLSPDGRIKIYNHDGATHAAVDVFGYYVDHNHDDRYYTEDEVDAMTSVEVVLPNLSAGALAAYGDFTFVPEATFDASTQSVTTTTDGRLQIAKSGSVDALCTGANDPRIYFLLVDDVAVESSAVLSLSNSDGPVSHLFGVTADVVTAGAHTVEIGVECLAAATATVDVDESYSQASVVVLPDHTPAG